VQTSTELFSRIATQAAKLLENPEAPRGSEGRNCEGPSTGQRLFQIRTGWLMLWSEQLFAAKVLSDASHHSTNFSEIAGLAGLPFSIGCKRGKHR
jgi:hypothetical protein